MPISQSSCPCSRPPPEPSARNGNHPPSLSFGGAALPQLSHLMTTDVGHCFKLGQREDFHGDFKYRFAKSSQFLAALRTHLQSYSVFNPLPEAALGKEVSGEMGAEIPSRAQKNLVLCILTPQTDSTYKVLNRTHEEIGKVYLFGRWKKKEGNRQN